MLAAQSLLGVMAAIVLSRHGLDPGGKPLGTEFISFYAAGRVALTDGAAAAYSPILHGSAQQALFPRARYGYTTFLYPPPFLLLCLPLALLPYMVALGAWLGAGLAALAAAMRPLLPAGIGSAAGVPGVAGQCRPWPECDADGSLLCRIHGLGGAQAVAGRLPRWAGW